MSNTIYRGNDNGRAYSVKVEGEALAAIDPGTIVEQSPTGLAVNTDAATVFGNRLLVADRNHLQQEPLTTAWTINENMVAIKTGDGDRLMVLVAAGNDITSRGLPLSLNGAGLLKIAVTDGTEQIIAHSNEIVNAVADTLVEVSPA